MNTLQQPQPQQQPLEQQQQPSTPLPHTICSSVTTVVNKIRQAKADLTSAETAWRENKQQRDAAKEMIQTWMQQNHCMAVCLQHHQHQQPVKIEQDQKNSASSSNSGNTFHLIMRHRNRHLLLKERIIIQAFQALSSKPMEDILCAAMCIPKFRRAKGSVPPPPSPTHSPLPPTPLTAPRSTTITLQDALFNIVIAQLNEITSLKTVSIEAVDKCPPGVLACNISGASANTPDNVSPSPPPPPPPETYQAMRSYPSLLETTKKLRRLKLDARDAYHQLVCVSRDKTDKANVDDDDDDTTDATDDGDDDGWSQHVENICAMLLQQQQQQQQDSANAQQQQQQQHDKVHTSANSINNDNKEEDEEEEHAITSSKNKAVQVLGSRALLLTGADGQQQRATLSLKQRVPRTTTTTHAVIFRRGDLPAAAKYAIGEVLKKHTQQQSCCSPFDQYSIASLWSEKSQFLHALCDLFVQRLGALRQQAIIARRQQQHQPRQLQTATPKQEISLVMRRPPQKRNAAATIPHQNFNANHDSGDDDANEDST